MKSKLKLTVKICALLLVIIMPFFMLFSVAFLFGAEFEDSFVGILDDKLDRLYSIEEEKIVIVGCSSAAFGYDSEIIERYLEMPVVNLGVYAALGTKLMLDLSKDAIGEGDIVIIAPELDSQTLSLYFDGRTTLRALDGSPKYLFKIPEENRSALLGSAFGFASEKLSYKLFGAPAFEGIYNSKSFNVYGDIGAYRAENVMFDYYEPDHKIRLQSDIIAPDFIEYLNEYAEYVKSVGASIYFEFCPMNRLGFDEDSGDAESRLEFEEYLRESLCFTVIASSIEDYVYDERYFYDSNLHLNSKGAVKHTVSVVRDLFLELGIPKAVTEEIPEPPPLPETEVRFFGEDKNAAAFEYEKMANGAYMIVGIKEEYTEEAELTVPLGYNGYKVMAIGAGAFSDSKLECLILSEDTNIKKFQNGAFIGADRLTDIYIYYPDCTDIEPPEDNFEGINPNFKVHIPAGSGYKNDPYGWGDMNIKYEYIE